MQPEVTYYNKICGVTFEAQILVVSIVNEVAGFLTILYISFIVDNSGETRTFLKFTRRFRISRFVHSAFRSFYIRWKCNTFKLLYIIYMSLYLQFGWVTVCLYATEVFAKLE